MKILEHKEEFIVWRIRDAIALDPLVSMRKLQKVIKENTGRSISDKYLSKLMKKIRTKTIVESDRKQLNERLAEVRERYRVLSENLMRTIYWDWTSMQKCGIQKPKEKERQSAIKLLAQMELALLKAELDVGAFEDQQLSIRNIRARNILVESV